MQAGKLGSVLFQFHLTFSPTAGNKQHVEWCRSRLHADITMAVEFRNRAWFATETACASTQVCFCLGLMSSVLRVQVSQHR